MAATKVTIDPQTALERLREGNRRFVANVRSVDALLSQTRRGMLAATQAPFAIVLGCSDSRSPAEIVFDQGLGDLFVIRVAGNVVAPSQVGSVEFAVDRFGTGLVVVMGHSHCGAVDAAIESFEPGSGEPSRPMLSIVDRVRPSVEPLIATEMANDRERLKTAAARANVRVSTSHLRQGSRLLEQAVLDGRLWVVGAYYDIASGEVDFFDVPGAR